MLAKNFKRIVILTGAGISAESGIKTFRDNNGLWENHKIEEVATMDGFRKSPRKVWQFYSNRRFHALLAKPNSAHKHLVEFQKAHPDISMTLITQNVDSLHQLADPDENISLIPMHGNLFKSQCTKCQKMFDDNNVYFNEDGNLNSTNGFKIIDHLPYSPCCEKLLRPAIVWFGETPYYLNDIVHRLSMCDLFVSIGTSGVVYPAAGFVEIAKSHGAITVCLNKEKLLQNTLIDFEIIGLATKVVPQFFSL